MDRLPKNNILINDLNVLIPSHIYPIAASMIGNTIFSCKDYSSNVPFTCQDMAHAWDPSCFKSACHLFFGCFKEGINIYGFLYLVSVKYIIEQNQDKNFNLHKVTWLPFCF